MPVQSAFEPVLFVVCGLGLVAAVLAIVTTNKTWEEYGKSRLLMDHEAPALASSTSLHERDVEIRQLLEARNQRLARRGQAPIDVERELSRLTALEVDSGLQAEIRELVIARNHRRVRAGKSPLDVETEVARQIAELTVN